MLCKSQLSELTEDGRLGARGVDKKVWEITPGGTRGGPNLRLGLEKDRLEGGSGKVNPSSRAKELAETPRGPVAMSNPFEQLFQSFTCCRDTTTDKHRGQVFAPR